MIALIRGSDGGLQWVALCRGDGVWRPLREAGRLDFVQAVQDGAVHLQALIERALRATREAHACYRCGSIVQAVKRLEDTLAVLEEAAAHAPRLLDQPGPEDELAADIELAGPERSADEIFLLGVLAAAAQSYRETGRPVSPWAWREAAAWFRAMASASSEEDGTS